MFSENLRKARLAAGLGVNETGRRTGLSPSYLSALERNVKINPSKETMGKIAEALNVSVDRLTGESASSIIENRLNAISLSMPELALKAGVPINFLLNLDNIQPDDHDYDTMTKIAKALEIQPGILLGALARQEPPVYDGGSDITPEEAFGTPSVEIPNLEIYPVGKLVNVPIIGTVTAGPNGLAYEDYQGLETVEADYVKGGNYFYLRIKGDSMIGDGILPGDLALVRETPEVEYGTLAIVIIDGQEGTLKRVYQNGDNIILQSSNPKCPPRIFKNKDMENVRIVGQVKSTIRNY